MSKEYLISTATRIKYYRPTYPDSEGPLKIIPYMTLPIRQEDLITHQINPENLGLTTAIEYSISEGWYYSKNVTKIIPFRHAAVDFSLPYGFPVAAPCDGYVISSYYSYPLIDAKGNLLRKNGKVINNGLGYFVQIYNTIQGRIVQLGHLSDISNNIPFSKPIRDGVRWLPTNNVLTSEQMISGKNPNVVYVKTGETVGYVGYSGLTYGEDYQSSCERPYRINPNAVGTWSAPHIHMDESARNFITGKKDWRRDPYAIYGWNNMYPTHYNKITMKEENLFLVDQFNRPFFADRI